MATLSFSGKSSYSNSEAVCLKLEHAGCTWDDFSDDERDVLVRHYAPKIKFLALRLKARLPKHVELGELISAGTMGLVEALGKFRNELGIKFDTYAENRIRGAMLDELRRMDWFPRNLRHRVRQIEGALRQMESENGRFADEEDIVRLTGLDIKEVREGMEAMQGQACVSLEAIEEILSTEKHGIEGEPYRTAAYQDLINKVAGIIDSLTPREQLVLSLYYSEELNMRETAEVMGITEGRVSQLHSRALTRLRNKFQDLYGPDAAA